MGTRRFDRWRWVMVALGGTLGSAGCEVVEPESHLRFLPPGLDVEVGETLSFSGVVTLGTATGTWSVQPSQISIAAIEVTGQLTATITCFQEGAGAFVLSVLSTQGTASGSFYFACYL